MNIIPMLSFFIGRVFFNFRQKMDGPSQMEKDIKVHISAPI